MKNLILLVGVLMFLFSCGGQGKVSSQGNENEGELKQVNTTLGTNLPETQTKGKRTEKKTEPLQDKVSNREIPVPIIKTKPDSIYPKEYTTPNGQERYKKMLEGVYVYSKSYTKRDWDMELTRLDFFDTTGRKIKVFDIRKNNPYTKEYIPTLERGNYQDYVYDSFVPLDKSMGKSKYKAEKHFSRSQIPVSEGLPVIGYHLLGMKNHAIVDWKFTAICMDENGNVLRTFKDLDIDPYAFCLSENKKFFCVAYGGLRGEELTRLRNNGFRIYEMETGKLVYELSVDDKHSISGASPDNKKNGYDTGITSIVGNDFSEDDTLELYFINFDKRNIYKRKFSYEERKYILERDFEGLNLRDKENDRRWKLYFNKDFTIEKF